MRLLAITALTFVLLGCGVPAMVSFTMIEDAQKKCSNNDGLATLSIYANESGHIYLAEANCANRATFRLDNAK